MSDQLLSADPAAGLLSTDPNAAAPPPAPKGHDFKILGVNIHVPSEDKPRLDSNVIGWGDRGAGVSPEAVLSGAQAVRSVAQAAPGLASKASEVLAQAAPYAKYRLVKGALDHAGLPDFVSEPIAFALSGYKRGAKPAAAAEAEIASGPHLDRAAPVRPSDLTPQQLTERIQQGSGVPAQTRGISGPASAPPVSPGAAPPAVPASPTVAPAPPSPATPIAESGPSLPAPAKLRLTADEWREFQRLQQRGMPSAQAMSSVMDARALKQMLGTPSLSEVDTTFPKGMRGKPRE